MAQKSHADESTSPSRPKYDFHHYKALSGITDDLAPSEKLERLHTLFKSLAAGTHAISDNLQPGELQRRLTAADGRSVTPTHMKMLLDENMHAIDLLRDCMLEITMCPETLRKDVLTECMAVYKTEAKRLETGITEFNAMFSGRPALLKSNNKDHLRPFVNGIVFHALPFFLVFEDMIAA